MSDGTFIAVDWGNSNRRAWRIEADGQFSHVHADDRGTLKLKGQGVAAEIAALRRTIGDLPMLMAGTIGSADGWGDVGRLTCPVGLSDLADGLIWIEPGRTAILPGLKYLSEERVDILRGEDVQILGAVESGLIPRDALVCQPGTHSKWGLVKQGRLVEFTSAMTGEAFALIRDHSLIGEVMEPHAQSGPAFQDGVRDGANGDLLTLLFGCRAAVMMGRLSRADCASRLSGLMIGSEISAHIGAKPVHLIATEPLGSLYKEAIETLGGTALIADCISAFIAGTTAIWRHTA
jgi:2-dehydro-3-deoxygalactonokinase